ncbi:MAG: hypothetical protein H6715_06670 [Myxococcales bacterium]|nr:hypothetical protein [Myxococcales bacterium]MCB9708231.1 hypothetical protein [Myxococcales bacterium]
MAPGEFRLGYNQGWFSTYYASDLTTDFSQAVDGYAGMARIAPWRPERLQNPDGIEGYFAMARACGARVIRLWAFEGYTKEGCDIDIGSPEYRIRGLREDFVRNLDRVMQAAIRHDISIYWTALVGNWARHWDSAQGTDVSRWRELHYNILNARHGTLDAYNEHVLGPFVRLLSVYKTHVYALDLMNEIQGSVPRFWSGDWANVRSWIKQERAFVRAIMPSLKVTASCGHHTAVTDLLKGRMSDLGLDFFDVHIYNDDGRIPRTSALGKLVRRAASPLLLGEFGQTDLHYSDELKTRVTLRFIQHAQDAGFVGALAWRLDDYRPNGIDACRHTYVYPRYSPEHGYMYYARPAVQVIAGGYKG